MEELELGQRVPGIWFSARNPEHCCIYRVPSSIRRVNPEAYTPQLLIIGPLHHSLKSQALNSLKDVTTTKFMGYLNMEKHKRFYLSEFRRRFQPEGEGGENVIGEFGRIIERNEEMIRASYSESTTWIPSQEFVDMILHDSVFILEFILRSLEEAARNTKLIETENLRERIREHAKKLLANRMLFQANQENEGDLENHAISVTEEIRERYQVISENEAIRARYEVLPVRNTKIGDPLMDEPCLTRTVKEDLMLLENQLPYFILQNLFDSITIHLESRQNLFNRCGRGIVDDPRLIRLLIILFGLEIQGNPRIFHFTDLFRYARVKASTPGTVSFSGTYPPIARMYNAEELDSRGVKFEAIEDEFSLTVNFENGCLSIPYFSVINRLEKQLRNVMALEQCRYPYDSQVCNYIKFLDFLIDTPKDVGLLVEKGIIRNLNGQNESVAEMVNKLNLGITDIGSRYYVIALALNAHYSSKWNEWYTNLKRVYFGNLWTGTATVAAIVLLVMTFLQMWNSFPDLVIKK